MPGNREVLLSMLREASRQSGAFQSLIYDYALDVMHDPTAHLRFTTRLQENLPMLHRIGTLKTSLESSDPDAGAVSTAMTEVLDAASALPPTSHTSMGEIADLVAVELAYRRIDQQLDPPLVEKFPGK